ncbi:hypothetical protein DYB32_003699 [Aphanomyces invadans]|uniref:Uncharacterized protein n=1 Tax=Aphanomyces invadans TaxID=157072 RepID=A0A3R6Z5Y9_9STRA|nr:hypothetical protein DYB32_003699 [Aphanomyces invadans]
MKAQWCDPLYKGPGSELAKPNVQLDGTALKPLSTTPRVPEAKFPPLTAEEIQSQLAKGRAKLPPASYGILSVKLKAPSSLQGNLKGRRGTVVQMKGKLRSPAKVKIDQAMLKRRSSTIFQKPSDTLRKVSRAVGFVARKSTMASAASFSKQFKDVKPVYLDILRPLDTPFKSDE